MSRSFQIPGWINGRLRGLTTIKDETNGVLFYTRNNNICKVSGMFITGIGTPGHVIAEPKRVLLVNELFKRKNDLKFVKFHTHTKETIKMFGNRYLRAFSSGDLDSYREQFKHDKEFVAMLITPEVGLMCGLDNPTMITVPTSPELLEQENKIMRLLEYIKTEKGIELSLYRSEQVSRV
jgi:hypothetical protein